MQANRISKWFNRKGDQRDKKAKWLTRQGAQQLGLLRCSAVPCRAVQGVHWKLDRAQR